MSVDGSTAPGQRRDPVAGARAPSLSPRKGNAEVLLQLWREKVLFLIAFLSVLALAVALSLITPRSYTATARMLVKSGDEHIARPLLGGASNAAPDPGVVLQAEAELARSPIVAERVIADVGLARLFPQLAAAAANDGAHAAIHSRRKAVDAFGRRLSVMPSSASSTLHLSLSARDPGVATGALDTFMAHYRAYRGEVLSSIDLDLALEQRAGIERRLRAAEQAIRSFLSEEGVSDFDAELETAMRLTSDLSLALSEASADQSEAAGRAAGLRQRLSMLAASSDAPETAATQARANRGPAQSVELRRPSAPALSPDVEIGLADAAAAADARRSRAEEFARQLADAEAARARLALLEPEYRRLVRERNAIEAAANALSARLELQRAAEGLPVGGGAVTVLEPARADFRGTAPRELILALGAVLGLIAAALAVWFRLRALRTVATPRLLEEAIGLPVLAMTTDRPA